MLEGRRGRKQLRKMLVKQKQRKRRHNRVRAKIKGTAKIPRLCIFRSNKYIYAQIIDDDKANIIAASYAEATVKTASKLGKVIAQKAKDKSIEKVLFDRGGYKYHGRIKAFAEGAKKEGLQF